MLTVLKTLRLRDPRRLTQQSMCFLANEELPFAERMTQQRYSEAERGIPLRPTQALAVARVLGAPDVVAEVFAHDVGPIVAEQLNVVPDPPDLAERIRAARRS